MLVTNLNVHKRNPWLTLRFQWLGAILFALAIPYLLVISISDLPLFQVQAGRSALGALLAITIGAWLNRNLSALPGVASSASIIPCFSFSFGMVLVAILLLRLPYSNALLLASFVIVVIWFYIVYFFAQRRAGLVLGVVSGGQADQLYELGMLSCIPVTLDQPVLGCNAIAADLRHDHSDAWETRLADFVLAGLPVFHSKDLAESLTGRVELEHLSENSFGTLGPRTALLEVKSVADILLSFPALIVAFPVMLLAAIAIKLDSPGPIFFRQERMGFRGKPFTVIKFRTMAHQPKPVTANSIKDFMTKENDTRITRIGQFLRRSRIDELPQLFNIMRGEMSFIGPRPEASALSDLYQKEIPYYRYRHVVKPGMSGWAQVTQGHVAEVDEVREKLAFDFYYIKHFSVWLDALIVAKTIWTMATGFGSK